MKSEAKIRETLAWVNKQIETVIGGKYEDEDLRVTYWIWEKHILEYVLKDD